MKKILVVACLLAACGDTDIGPDPTSSTNTGGSTSNMGGSPSDGGGGAHDGGGGTNQGGNGGGVPGGGYESGSRLKVRTLVGADGARSPAGWHDAELDIDCEWRKASDGQTRCLPVAALATYYTSNCTVPIVRSVGCPAPLHVLDEVTCGGGVKVRSVGAQMVPADVWVRDGETCTSLPAVPPGTFYSTSDEIAPSTYVAATVEVEQ